MRSNQSFSDKVLTAIIIIFILKLVYILYSSKTLGFGGVVTSIIVTIIVFLFLAGIASTYNKNTTTDYSSGKSNVLLRESLFNKIRQKYYDLAKKHEEEKNYKKASYIYMKLLKDHYEAAEVLERGKLYNEAALIYLKQLNDKKLAAQCYENAKSYKQAIKLHEELNNTEKIGDLYVLLNDDKSAKLCYQKVIDEYKNNFQYVKASLVYRNKLKDTAEAQALLLDGWRTQKDAFNCLNNYFENIKNYSQLEKEIVKVYQNDTSEENKVTFLQILKHEYKKDSSLQEVTKGLAYEIISGKIDTNKQISSELVYFNRDNASISKDIIKFKTNFGKKR